MKNYKGLWKVNKDELVEVHRNVTKQRVEITSNEKITLINRVTMDKRLSAVDTRVYIHILTSDYSTSQEEIGRDLGISRVTTNRAISNLKNLGFLDVERVLCKDGDKSYFKTEYKILKEPKLINNIEVLMEFISKCDLFQRNGEKLDTGAKFVAVKNEYTNFNVIDNIEVVDKHSKTVKEHIKRALEDELVDKNVRESYKVLLFGAYLEAKYNAEFTINDFIKHSILEIDRYRGRVNKFILMAFTNIYRTKLMYKEYSLAEALTVLNIGHIYSAFKKDTLANDLDVTREIFLKRILNIIEDNDLFNEFGILSVLQRRVGNKRLLPLKDNNDKVIKEASKFDIIDTLLLSVLFDDNILKRFDKTYKMSLNLTLIAVCGIEFEEALNEYEKWRAYSAKYKFEHVLKTNFY